jgi:hypothetical protein
VNILLGCEESGTLRDILRDAGHNAWPCDLLSVLPRGRYQQYHLYGDVRWFTTAPGGERWDMLIAFPPCTYLCISGARYWATKQQEQQDAIKLIRDLMAFPADKIAIENPIGVISTLIRKPDQTIQPWQHGHGETKATCLWLKGLPKLRSTNRVAGRETVVALMSPGKHRARDRSKTYDGIAQAMADQWTSIEPAPVHRCTRPWRIKRAIAA